jgi:hypothetical protein
MLINEIDLVSLLVFIRAWIVLFFVRLIFASYDLAPGYVKSDRTGASSTSVNKDEILANHRSFMTFLNIPSGKESEDLPYLYWIPKLHKTPYKERYIAGSSICSTKELSIHLTKILSAVNEGQQKYCETVYSHSDINPYEYKNKSARRGAQFVPIGMPTICWNSVLPKETNMLSMRNSSILITCCSE